MNEQKKKIFNYRPIVIVSLMLIAGSVFCVCAKLYANMYLVAMFSVLLILGISILFKKNIDLLRFYKLFALIVLVPFLIGAIYTELKINNLLNVQINSGYYSISGKVDSITMLDEGVYLLRIDSLTIDGEELNKSAKVSLVYSGDNSKDLNLGDTVLANGRLVVSGNLKEKIDNGLDNLTFGTFTTNSLTINKSGSVRAIIKSAVKDKIYSCFDEESAMTAYAMLFGDKSDMRPDIKKNFSLAGLSHVLAVSGLHVGFIIALFGFLLSKLIKNKYAYSGLMLLIILVYAYFCNFSVSVLRATVMASVLMLATISGRQYDKINSLAVASIVCFMINPLCVYGLSYMLSFSVVFAIVALSPIIQEKLSKVMPRNLSTAISVSGSAWIGSVGTLLHYFNSISIYSIIINLIIIPYVGFVFMILVVSLIVSFVPMLEFVLQIPNFLYKLLYFVTEGFASIKGASIHLSCDFCGILLVACAIILIGDYSFVKHKNKLLAILSGAIVVDCILSSLL